MKERGIGAGASSKVQVDPWPAGGFPPPEIPADHRMMREICFVREFPENNGYAHPVEGLIAYVDRDALPADTTPSNGAVQARDGLLAGSATGRCSPPAPHA